MDLCGKWALLTIFFFQGPAKAPELTGLAVPLKGKVQEGQDISGVALWKNFMVLASDEGAGVEEPLTGT